jgi:tetratricopeptide (TPR) repeat protein
MKKTEKLGYNLKSLPLHFILWGLSNKKYHHVNKLFEKKDKEYSIELNKEAIEECSNLKDKSMLILSYGTKLGRTEDGIRNYHLGLELIGDKIDYSLTPFITKAYEDIGYHHLEKNEKALAIKNFEKAFSIKETFLGWLSWDNESIITSTLLANLLILEKEYDLTIILCEKCKYYFKIKVISKIKKGNKYFKKSNGRNRIYKTI